MRQVDSTLEAENLFSNGYFVALELCYDVALRIESSSAWEILIHVTDQLNRARMA